MSDSNFVRVLSEDRTHFFVVTSERNEVIATSLSYPTAAMMELDIEVVRVDAPNALVAVSDAERSKDEREERDQNLGK